MKTIHTSFLMLFLLFASCQFEEGYECESSNDFSVHKFIHSGQDEDFIDDIIKFEESLGAVILFNNSSSDSTLFNVKKNNLLNPRDNLNDNSYWRNCSGCFSTSGIQTYIVAIRPQKHPFVKEVAVYAVVGGESHIYYYFKNDILDQLIPDSILANYDSSFSMEEFMCFRHSLILNLNEYYGVGKPTYSKCSEPSYNPKREFHWISELGLDDRKKWVEGDPHYELMKKYKYQLGWFSWETYDCSGFVDMLKVIIQPDDIKREDPDVGYVYDIDPEEIFIKYEASYSLQELKEWGVIE